MAFYNSVGLWIFVQERTKNSQFFHAFKLEVSVDGRLGLAFSPGLYITLSHVRIRNRGIAVATSPEARLGIDLIPLLFQRVQLNRISLEEPVISIVRDLAGNLNVDNPGRAERVLSAGKLPPISFSEGTLRYFDVRSELLLEATDCRFDAQDLELASADSIAVPGHLSLTADLACGTFRKNAFAGSGLKVRAVANHGAFHLDPITMDLFGGAGSGRVVANFSGDTPRYKLDFALPDLRAEVFSLALTDTAMLEGPMDFTIHLTMDGDTGDEVIRSATGQFSLRGSQLTLTGSDIDQELNQYESSQNLDLIDAGAFFFIGPLGLFATKGYDFTALLGGSDGTSQIQLLVSDWNVEKGEAHAQDMAMATLQHRLALHGSLDFADEQFRDVIVAVVDLQGCAQVKQKDLWPFPAACRRESRCHQVADGTHPVAGKERDRSFHRS